MAGIKITDLAALTTADAADYLCIVDVSDTSQSAAGTTKKIEVGNMFESGTWTPTVVGTPTLSGTVTPEAQATYIKIGNVVQCSFVANVQLDAAETSTQFNITLPIASNFTIGEQAIGQATAKGSTNDVTGIVLSGDITNNNFYISINFLTAGNGSFFYFSFQYEVL